MKYSFLCSFSKRSSLLPIILLFIFSSCSKDFIEEKPLDFLAPQNAYSTKAGIAQGVTGLYARARADWYLYPHDDAVALYGLGTDEAYDGEEPGGLRFLTNYTTSLTPDHSLPTLFWRNCYALIQSCNVLIDRIDVANNDIWENDAEKNAYLAEARFFRAYAYRILVILWGDAPIVQEVIASAKTDFTRAPKADIYKQIEDDFNFAATNLPTRGNEKASGRITQGAAWHFLSEAYLAQSKFQLAVDAASNVINNYGYALMTNRFGTKLGHDVFGSGDVYFDLFTLGNQNLAENTEAIWVIQVEPYITGGGQVSGEYQYGPAYFRIGNTPDGKKAILGELVNGVYTGYSDTLGRPVARARPTNYLTYDIWMKDWNNDIRNAEHNIKRNFYFDNPESIYNKQKIDFSLYPPGTRDNVKDTCQYIFPYWIKVASPLEHFTEPQRSGGGRTHKDLYAIRLAETLLLRAEAYLGLEKKDLAANDINLIRNRAGATPVDPEEVTIDYILDERARELYTEEFRMLTLMRLGNLVERVRKYNNNPLTPKLNIQDYNNLWPIPQTEIDLNIESKMQQNPGY